MLRIALIDTKSMEELRKVASVYPTQESADQAINEAQQRIELLGDAYRQIDIYLHEEN